MEEKLGIITKEDLEVLSKQAYESAKSKGFYSDTGIDTTFYLMFIIVEMSEALQADRKDRHGSIEDYESEIEMGRDIPTAYRNTLEGKAIASVLLSYESVANHFKVMKELNIEVPQVSRFSITQLLRHKDRIFVYFDDSIRAEKHNSDFNEITIGEYEDFINSKD